MKQADPRSRSHRSLSPDQGTLDERLDEIDGSAMDEPGDYWALPDDALEQSPETGIFPHDA